MSKDCKQNCGSNQAMSEEMSLVEAHLRDKVTKLILSGNATNIVIAMEIEKIADEMDRMMKGRPTDARKQALKQVATSEDMRDVYINFCDEPLCEM